MYSIGQIVRIKCVNVLTYDEVEIRPCEKLNLIIGANGSGKSTLICAIILGLGGNPAVVGRAADLPKYVKLGSNNATIEIELYHPDGNDIIVRKYNTKNQSRFSLNGREIQLEKVHKLMRKYNIQINNLCQILPQEKLEEFAKMNHHERLEGTIKTVGNKNLADWLAELKESKTKDTVVKKKIEHMKQDLIQMTRKKDELAIEARIIKEKEFLVESLKLLQQRRRWTFYYHMKETSQRIEQALKDKKEICKNMVHLLRKCRSNVQNLRQDVRGQDTSIKRINDELHELIRQVKTKQNDITTLTDKITEIKSDLLRQKRQVQTQESDVKQLQKAVAKIQEQICNVDDLAQRINEIQNQIDVQQEEIREKYQSQQHIKYQMGRKNEELQAVNNRLQRLNSVNDYKLQILERNYPDSYKALRWIEQNRDMFRGNIYGPIFVDLTVDEVSNAKYVEMCVANRDLLAFLCENREDTNALLVELTERMKLRVNVVTAPDTSIESIVPKRPIEQLRRYGFHSYVFDFISGPDPILTYLACTFNLHNIPVGNERTNEMTDQIPSDCRLYFTDKYRIQVKIASFTNLPIQSSSEIGDSRLLKVNTNRNDHEDLDRQKEALQREYTQIKETYESYERSVKEGDEILDKLKEEGRRLKSQQSGQSRLKDALKTKTRELHRLQNSFVDINVTKKKASLQIKLTLTNVCNKFIELSTFFNKLIECYSRLHLERLEKEQRERIYQKNLKVTNDFVAAVKQEASSLRKLEFKKRKMVKLTGIIHQWALRYTQGIDPASDQFRKRKYFQKLNANVIVLYRLINKFQAKINCLSSSNQGLQIFVEFRRIVRDVEKLKNKIDKKEENLRNYYEHIEDIKGKWMEEVEHLVSTINENFSKFFANMGCAGEVSFDRGEADDYNKYGIHIRVKFRDEASLQILNAQTQSGGERAVSVAIYLLSLQELTSVPFRCIDEINQGMDADNERRIFNLLTQATENQCNTQYFLLTPKLLPNLQFTPSMQILCPFNGVGSIPHSQLPLRFGGSDGNASGSPKKSQYSQKSAYSRSQSPQPSMSSQAYSQNNTYSRSPSPQPSTSRQAYSQNNSYSRSPSPQPSTSQAYY